MRLLLIFIFTLQTIAFAAPPRPAKTVGEMLELASTTLNPNDLKFLKAKAESVHDVSISFEDRGRDRYLIRAQTKLIPFAILPSGPREVRFELNNHRITHDLNDPIELLWFRMEKVLPRDSEAALLTLLLPRAHAITPLIHLSLAIAIGATTYVLEKKGKENCEKYTRYESTCVSDRWADDTKKGITIKEATNFDRAWSFSTAESCRDTQRSFRACIKKKVQSLINTGTNVSPALRSYVEEGAGTSENSRSLR